LGRLATAELLGSAEPAGELAFRHPLTHEVAYRTQLLDRRRRTHAAVARGLLAMHGSAAPTHAALLAHHFEEASEYLEAARWHERAGRRVARSDPADGVRHCRQVTALLAALPESRETMTLAQTSRIALLEVGRLASARTTAAHALAELARVAGLREAVGHSTAPALCRTWWELASVYLGHAAEAQAALEALLAEESDSGLQALYGTHGFLC